MGLAGLAPAGPTLLDHVYGTEPAGRVQLALVAQSGRAPGFDPGRRGSTPLGGLDIHIDDTTPWPSGEARACNARNGGSTPPGVFHPTGNNDRKESQ